MLSCALLLRRSERSVPGFRTEAECAQATQQVLRGKRWDLQNDTHSPTKLENAGIWVCMCVFAHVAAPPIGILLAGLLRDRRFVMKDNFIRVEDLAHHVVPGRGACHELAEFVDVQ